MKKILYIVNLDQFFISHRIDIAIEARKKGYEVHIATKITSGYDYLKEKGLTVHPISLDRSSINPFSNLNTFYQIFTLIRSIRPSIVHMITIKPMIFGCLAAYFSKVNSLVVSISGLGFVFSSRRFDVILLRLLIFNLYKLVFLHRNLSIIFQNENDKKVISRITSLKNKNTYLIPGSGVDLSLYSPGCNPEGIPIIMFAGRLLISKGVKDFIEASKLVNNAKFVVVGKFEKDNRDFVNPSYINKAVEQGLIEYWGFSSNMPDTLKQSSVVVLPSYYGEGLPKVLIEASASGKPIITTDHPGCRDAVKHGENGLIVPIKDVSKLAKAIQLLVDNCSIRRSMGERGRTISLVKYDINTVVRIHMKIYESNS
tara:strand:- start:5833 stop:6942 length:1110 start_codon:yes stop_codon:yes gene_type:complete